MGEYYGQEVHSCGGRSLDWLHTYAVVVSGAALNPFGHMLLNLGGRDGVYYHATGKGMNPYWYPFFLTAEGYPRYLASGGKKELTRYALEITQPEAAQRKLESLLSDKYFWGVIPHNCVAFVKMVAEAGGCTDIGSSINLPSNVWQYDYHTKGGVGSVPRAGGAARRGR